MRNAQRPSISLLAPMGGGTIRMNGKAEREWWQIFHNFEEREGTGKVPNSFFAIRASQGDSPAIRALQTSSVGDFRGMESLVPADSRRNENHHLCIQLASARRRLRQGGLSHLVLQGWRAVLRELAARYTQDRESVTVQLEATHLLQAGDDLQVSISM
ncbi:MAG: hypothetical protein RRC34_11055 [Lentisphaeria bacterium]|nr:hypothetical protein [Lentisphaeria bacterium]